MGRETSRQVNKATLSSLDLTRRSRVFDVPAVYSTLSGIVFHLYFDDS